MSQSLSHAAHLPPASTRLSSGARLALTAAILLALAACTMSSVLLIELLRTRARATAGMDHVLAQLEATCAPSAPPLMFPMAQTIPFKGEVRLTDKLVIPFKDTIKMPQGLTVPFQGNVPINTKVRVPLFQHGPTVDVPINTVVRVETQLTLPAGILIPVGTRVSLPAGLVIPMAADMAIDQNFPIDVCRPDSPVKHAIETAIQQLREARGKVR
jgi:hypothetical protein